MPTCICAVVGCSNNTYHLRNWKLTFANYIIVTLVPAFAFVTLLSHSFHFRLRKRTRKEDKDGSRTLTEKIQIPENYGTLHTMTEHGEKKAFEYFPIGSNVKLSPAVAAILNIRLERKTVTL